MMPNEVLMELFEYYDFYSLFFSFSLINARFDALLTRCRAVIDLDLIAPNAFIHFLAQIVPQINDYHIQSLHASNIHQMFILGNDDCLFHFARIQSLRLFNIPPNIIKMMVERVHFYRLEHISLDHKPGQVYFGWYPSEHFLDSNRYPYLRTYNDSLMWILEGTTVLSSLEHVRMDGASSSGNFLNLLCRSPRLKSFQAQFWLEPYEYLPSSPMYTHDALTNLHLKLGWDFHMSTIMYLFQSTPRVRKLTFTASNNRHYTVVNPHWWESVLSKYLLELKRLYLRVSSHNNDIPHNPDWPVDLDEQTVRQQIEASPYWCAHPLWQLTYEKQMPTAEHNYHRAAFTVT
jgi:hypothetical protein